MPTSGITPIVLYYNLHYKTPLDSKKILPYRNISQFELVCPPKKGKGNVFFLQSDSGTYIHYIYWIPRHCILVVLFLLILLTVYNTSAVYCSVSYNGKLYYVTFEMQYSSIYSRRLGQPKKAQRDVKGSRDSLDMFSVLK